MKKRNLFLCGSCLILSLCSCSLTQERQEFVPNAAETVIQGTSADTGAVETEAPDETSENETNDSVSFEKHIHYKMDDGELILDDTLRYTINHVKVITDLSVEGLPKDHFLWGFTPQTTWDQSQQNHPSGVRTDGRLDSGYYMVLVDISCENINANLEDDGSTSYYENPYLFRADEILELYDYSLSDLNLFHHTIVNYYYNNQPFYPDHPCLFQAEIGETVQFYIGFLNYNPNLDISKLKLSASVVNSDMTGFETFEVGVK